jgi:hypothetical protein
MSGIATALDHRLVIDGIFFRTWAGAGGGICRNGSGTGVDHEAGQSQADHFDGHFEGQNDRPVSPETQKPGAVQIGTYQEDGPSTRRRSPAPSKPSWLTTTAPADVLEYGERAGGSEQPHSLALIRARQLRSEESGLHQVKFLPGQKAIAQHVC